MDEQRSPLIWRWPSGVAALLVLVLLASAAQAAAGNIYRYVDNSGKRIYTTVIPPEYVGSGYEVLNDRGQVVRVVPRTPTAGERAALVAAEEAERQRQQAEQAQRENDNMLRRRYRSVAEFERERDEVLAGFAREMTTAVNSRNSTEIELQRREQVVAEHMAAGREVPAEAQASLDTQRELLDRFVLQVQRLEVQHAQQAATYESNIQRLGELLGGAEDSPAQ